MQEGMYLAFLDMIRIDEMDIILQHWNFPVTHEDVTADLMALKAVIADRQHYVPSESQASLISAKRSVHARNCLN